MTRLCATRSESFWKNKKPLASVALRYLAAGAVIAFLSPEKGVAQDGLCGPKQGSAVIICGTNGGTTSQIFSPGSVIIMRQESLAFSGDLPNSGLSEEAAVARDTMAFLGGSFVAGDDITGFVTGFDASRDQSGTDFERAYTSDRRGAIVGLRVERPGYAWLFGFDTSDENQDYEAGQFRFSLLPDRNPLPLPPASVDRDELGVSLGVSFDLRPGVVWHVAGRIGRIDLETQRLSYNLESTDLPGSPVPRETFVGRGSTEGTSIAAQTGISYGRPLGAGFHGGLSGTFLFTREEFDAFTERVSEPWEDGTNDTFRFGEDERTSFVGRIGIEVARPVSISGALIIPSLRVAWLHEFSDDSRTIDVHASKFLTGSTFKSTNFTIQTNEPDRNYFTIGASIGTVFADGRGSLAVDYETIIGHDFVDEQLIGLRLGYRF